MGNEGDLWDDSALINAFDAAISNYKVMHHTKTENTLIQSEYVPSTEKESVSEKFDEIHDNTSHSIICQSKGEDEIAGSNASWTEKRDTANVSTPEIHNDKIHEPHVSKSQCMDVQEAFKDYSNSQGAEEYNQLLKKYYELEEERQKVLEQLYQYGSSDLGVSDVCTDGYVNPGPCSTSQAHPISTCHTSQPTAICSCCAYLCPYCVGSCSTVPGCSLFGTGGIAKNCVDTSVTTDDHDNIVKSAVGAAERAILSINEKIPRDSYSNEGIDKDTDINEGNVAQSTGSKTDINVLLSAWYRAGFYTGKYLTEQQSKSNKKPC